MAFRMAGEVRSPELGGQKVVALQGSIEGALSSAPASNQFSSLSPLSQTRLDPECSAKTYRNNKKGTPVLL